MLCVDNTSVRIGRKSLSISFQLRINFVIHFCFGTWCIFVIIARKAMISLKENILTKPCFNFFFTCIYELQNWFLTLNFSYSNKTENSNFQFFLFYIIVFHTWVLSFHNVLKFLFSKRLWSIGIMNSKRVFQLYFGKSVNVKVNQGAKRISQRLFKWSLFKNLREVFSQKNNSKCMGKKVK